VTEPLPSSPPLLVCFPSAAGAAPEAAPEATPEAEPATSQVGGKAASLIRLTAAGLPVPPGAALTAAFFEPWYQALRATDAWTALLDAPPAEWPDACDALRALCPTLPADAPQRDALARALAHLPAGLYAVRSSSPEEDLSGASFAGGYETCLGVTSAGLLDAVRRCFASSLDARVLIYKQQRGFDPMAPRIAVVIQQQLDSAIAGVGFSLNPLNNDYDEAVFDAAWGLGESVVSGAVSPDHFVVNKVTGAVLAREPGAKQSALHLAADGGHTRQDGYRADDLTLDDARLAELTDLICRVECLYDMPVDIEWAVADGALHLLQARPVTAWVPLPPALITAPGARRRLYQDIALAGGLTTNAPISPLGQSWFASFAARLMATYVGELPVSFSDSDAMWRIVGGRMYQDLSNILWLSTPGILGWGQEGVDALVAATLSNIDAKTYRAERRPDWVSLRMLFAYFGIVWRVRGLLLRALQAALAPEKTRALLARETARFEAEMAALSDAPAEGLAEAGGLDALMAASGERVIRHVIEITMPPVMLGTGGAALARMIAPRAHADLADALSRGHEGNVVVDMGIALYRLSRLLPAEALADPEALERRLAARALPEAFLDGWADFLTRFGRRGPGEVDLGTARYEDSPALALRQLCQMGGGDFDPAAAQRAAAERREVAYAELRASVGPLRRWLLSVAYRWICLFISERDTPKHSYLAFFSAARRRALAQGARLAAAGRLDAAADVTGLTLADLSCAADPALDLRARRSENTRFIDKLAAHVVGFPAVIDSRGRILRPAPRPATPGELSGMPVSPGVARGPVVVLRTPDEKPVRPGDILVAHTTDPGWTPLFVNAAAVVLEVGGVLQHGAVVAREYGKPCVAGISELLSKLEDGQQVEVDGAAGIVRILTDG